MQRLEGGAEHAEPLEAGKDRRRSPWGPGRSQPCSCGGVSFDLAPPKKCEVTNLRCLTELRSFAGQPREAHTGGSDSPSVSTSPSSLKYRGGGLHLL